MTTTSAGADDVGNLRVVQWATGNIGTRSLRSVIEHPILDLVGVHVHSAEKAGRDAGELCGTDPVGVTATNDIDAIVALGADCVLYMARDTNVDELERLLESGANVVTTRGDFHRPLSMDAAARERIEAACARGGTSIHSTGSSPGFITEALPLVLTSLQRRLDGLHIDEYADLSQRDSPDLLFNIMGFGQDPAEIDVRRYSHGAISFGPSLHLLADAVGLPLDSVEGAGEVAATTREVEIAAGTLPAGSVGAQRMIVNGLRDGETLLRFRANWYATTDIDQDWDLRDTGWHVSVLGDAPFELDLRFSTPVEKMAAVTPGYTAHRAVNAVPYVCAAAPGIRTTADLPQVIPTFS